MLERVSELVGRGSFGVVVRAQDERTGAMVAVKVQRSTAHEAMLWSELRQLRRLRHPALPRVLEVGRLEAPFGELPARAPYLVTEWIGGSSLAALMRAPSRPSKEPLADLVISLLRDVGGALAVMHGAGLVHRDVAPANLHWDEQAGRAYLLDLGLAVAATAAMEAAEAAAPPLCDDVHGTLPYLPAEALTGRPEPRSDLYGLGASVIALVTGAPPFAPPQSTPEELALSRLLWAIVRDGQLPPLPQLPAPLAALVHRLTAREPSARPASAAALLDELEEVVAALPSHQPSPRQKAPAPPPPPLPLTGRAELVAALARHLDEDN